MQTQVTFRKIGHACFIARSGGQAILFDPWFGTPINHGTFHAFPDMVPPSKEELAGLVAIHISHIHDDHFDLATVAQLPKDIPVVIAKSRDRDFHDRLVKQGFLNVVELDPGETGYEIGPFGLTIYPKIPADGSFDSSVVLTVDGKNYYVGNDCIHPIHVYSQIYHTHRAFEGGFVGHTILNASLWCADFSDCQDFKIPMPSVLEIAQDMQRESWHHIQQVTRILKFRWISPYSSDLRFFNRDLLHHNALFFPSDEIYGFDLGAAAPVLISPGEEFGGLPDTLRDSQVKIHRDEIPADKILPNWIELHCPDVDLLSVTADARKYFEAVLHRQAKFWTSKFLIEINLSRNSESEKIRFYFDGQRLADPAPFSKQPADMIVEYPARALAELFKGRWQLRAFHRLYLHKVRYGKTRFGQTGVLSWS